MSRCSLCPGVNNCVSPSGPEDSPYILLGEAPGVEENRKEMPFVGKTGRELNEHYLPLAGLRRNSVRVHNAISCYPTSNQGKLDPKSSKDSELLSVCAAHHLYPELERRTHKLIVPMGNFACRAIDPTIDLELQHGIPLKTKWGPVFPMYHPAGGIHMPKAILKIRTDWIRLKKYLKGALLEPYDEFEGQEDYRVIETVEELDVILTYQWQRPLACDTETIKGGAPFCFSFSVEAGTGYVILASRRDLLDRLQWHLDKWRGVILWHNWLFDAEVVRRMGLRFNRKLIRDTMVLVFQLGNLPQRLKSLAYRELGMTMMDFMDMVTPHSKQRVLKYYRDMYAVKWPKPEAQMLRDKDGKWKIKQPHSLNTKLKTFYTYLAKDPNKDVFKSWANWVKSAGGVTEQSEDEDEEDQQTVQNYRGPFVEMVERECGEYPGTCITHAWEDDPAKVTFYSCRDADALLRIYPIIKGMATRVRKTTQELWRK